MFLPTSSNKGNRRLWIPHFDITVSTVFIHNLAIFDQFKWLEPGTNSRDNQACSVFVVKSRIYKKCNVNSKILYKYKNISKSLDPIVSKVRGMNLFGIFVRLKILDVYLMKAIMFDHKDALPSVQI